MHRRSGGARAGVHELSTALGHPLQKVKLSDARQLFGFEKKYSAILTRVGARPSRLTGKPHPPPPKKSSSCTTADVAPEPASPSTRRTGSRTPSRWVPLVPHERHAHRVPFQPLCESPGAFEAKCLTVTGGGGGSRLANSSDARCSTNASASRSMSLFVRRQRVGELASKRPRREERGSDIRPTARSHASSGRKTFTPNAAREPESEPEPEPEYEPESSEYESSESLSEPSPSEDEPSSSDRATNARMPRST